MKDVYVIETMDIGNKSTTLLKICFAASKGRLAISFKLSTSRLWRIKKESAQSDIPARRKCPKCGPILVFQQLPKYPNISACFGRFLWTW
jgi:hypothetical protein